MTVEPNTGPASSCDRLGAPGQRIELIDGQLIARELPSAEHQYACDQLCDTLNSGWRWADRDDLYAVTGIAVEIDRPRRTVVVPDVVVLNTRPIGPVCTAKQVALVAEVWSQGDSDDERAQRFDLYADAEIRYFWTVELGEPVLDAYEYLGDKWYRRRDTLRGRETGRIEAAPVPVSIGPRGLTPKPWA